MERRSSYRISLPGNIAFVRDELPHRRANIRSLNGGGGAVSVDALPWSSESQSFSAHVHLGSFAPFRAELALLGPAAQTEGSGLVAFRFQNLPASARGTLSAFLCDLHARHGSSWQRLLASRDHTLALGTAADGPNGTITERLTILALLRHDLEQGHDTLWLHRDAPATPIRLINVRLRPHDAEWDLLAASSDPEGFEIDEAKPHVFYLPGPLAVTWFRTTVRKLAASTLAIQAPMAIFQRGFRGSPRVSPPAGRPVLVTIAESHPHAEPIRRSAITVSGNGFAIELDPVHDLLLPGQQLERVCVDFPLGTVELTCVLRRCGLARGGQRMIAGFEIIDFPSPRDHDRWLRSLIPCVYPETALGDERLVQAAWGCLESSGYLEFIEAAERARLQGTFLEDWSRHARAPSLRARYFLSYQAGKPVGVAAANLIYPKTCMVHSFGIDRNAQGVGRVLELASASFLLSQAVADYTLTMLEAKKPINTVLIKRFVEQYSTRRDNVLDTYRVYKWHAGRSQPSPAGSDDSDDQEIEVVEASADGLRLLWHHQRETLSPLELDAYGWSPEDMTMQRFAESCARDGYERVRRIFFALHRGQPVAALTAEAGSEGMNVFSLLNSCSIVVLDRLRGQDEAVVRALLLRAIRFYRSRGKGAFLFLATAPLGEAPPIHDLGFAYVAEGWRWLAARTVIPAYLGYLHDLSIVGASRRAGSLPLAETTGTLPTPGAR